MESSNLSQLVALLNEGVAWYDVEPKLKPKLQLKHNHEPLKATDALVLTQKQHAQMLLEQEVKRFETVKSGKLSSDDKYLATMMKAGTLSDRVAALTVTTQASPLHSLLRLSQLITMASKKARRESLMAVDSLKDLFLTNLLPNDAKLRYFHQHPLHAAQHSPGHLVLWFFEHCLKTAYTQLLDVLASGMDDAIDNHKRACLRAANALLKTKPEQEASLLSMLVNKLGDPDRKVAASLHRMLQELLREHPAMKRVVVDEVERLLTRSKVPDRAKYNAVVFLNQIYLESGGEDADLATHLISVYFGLFATKVHGQKATRLTKKTKKTKTAAGPMLDEAMNRKLLSALLVGVNRAFPYANATSATFKDEIEALFQVVHRTHHSTSVQALVLLFQVMNSTKSVTDRFYTALYGKLIDPTVRETSKHTLFLNVVFRAMKADVSPARVGAFIKRLLQVASGMPPAFACAVLFLLSELLKVKPQLRTLWDEPESGSGSGNGAEEQFEDVKTEDVAFTNEVNEEKETVEETNASEGDATGTETERSASILARMFAKDQAGRDSVPVDTKVVQSSTTTVQTGYDATKRNPLFAGAETACGWELQLFMHHYHPSVQSFTRQLVENRELGIQYAGDPLVDFTQHAFFDKFVNKKPRHKVAGSTSGQAKKWTFAPMNTAAVLQVHEANVDASDHFFYKFFKERAGREATHARKGKKARNADALVEAEEETDDEGMDGFAQELAEGLMTDGDHDEEDPDTTEWSDAESEVWRMEDEKEEEGEDVVDSRNGGTDDDDEELREEWQHGSAKRKKQAPPTGEKRKGLFASADDYDEIVKEAMAKQTKDLTQRNAKKVRQT